MLILRDGEVSRCQLEKDGDESILVNREQRFLT